MRIRLFAVFSPFIRLLVLLFLILHKKNPFSQMRKRGFNIKIHSYLQKKFLQELAPF